MDVWAYGSIDGNIEDYADKFIDFYKAMNSSSSEEKTLNWLEKIEKDQTLLFGNKNYILEQDELLLLLFRMISDKSSF